MFWAAAVLTILMPCSSVPVRKNVSSPREAVIAGEGIGGDRRIGMPQMRLAVGVIDRRRDVESLVHVRNLKSAKQKKNHRLID